MSDGAFVLENEEATPKTNRNKSGLPAMALFIGTPRRNMPKKGASMRVRFSLIHKTKKKKVDDA
jgi:hypothetical protein